MEEHNINLIQYLKTAAELEASVYRLEGAVKQANSLIANHDPQTQYDKAIKLAEIKKTCYPDEKNYIAMQPQTVKPQETLAERIGAIALFFFGVVSLAPALAGGMPFLLILPVIMWGAGFYICMQPIKRAKLKNEENRIAYEKSVIEAKERYEKACADQNKSIDEIIQNANQQLAIGLHSDAVARSERDKLLTTLNETRRVLNELYSNNIIFPKYRNMVAMCSIYEYFVTGRCSELTGADGAYNIYEYEVRQNMIINKLDIIIDELEAIKNNQYMLYEEMRQTNELLRGVQNELASIYNSVSVIESNSYITAQCAQITAKNTEAIKYISLINS